MARSTVVVIAGTLIAITGGILAALGVDAATATGMIGGGIGLAGGAAVPTDPVR